MDLKTFKELHKRCDLRILTYMNKTEHALTCMSRECEVEPNYLDVTLPYESCRKKVHCANAGYCRDEIACNH